MNTEHNPERALLESLDPAWEELVPAAEPPDGFADQIMAGLEEPLQIGELDLEPAPLGTGRARRTLLAIAACVVLAAGGLAVALLAAGPDRRVPAGAAVAAGPRGDASVLAGEPEGLQALERVKQFARQERWEEARVLIDFAAELRPDDPTVQDYKLTIHREATASAALREARAAMQRKDYGQALIALAVVSPESLSAKEADALRRQARQARSEALLAGARRALDEGRYADARAEADRLLQILPDDIAAAQIKSRAEAGLVGRGKQPGAEETPLPPSPAEPAGRASLLAGQALSLYQAGQLDELRARAAELKLDPDTANSLRRFEALYHRGRELARNPGQASTAIAKLEQALELDQRLAGGVGKPSRELGRTLAKLYFVRGVDARTRRHYQEAFRDFEKTRQLAPDLETVSAQLLELERQAKKMYEEAYVIKGTAPARAVAKLRAAMGMIEPGNVYYSKCRMLADRIERDMRKDQPAEAAQPAPAEDLPPLHNTDVLSIMKAHLDELRTCVRKQKNVDRTVRGKMVVVFTIANDGRVADAKVSDQTRGFEGTYVAGCVKDVILRMKFAKFGGPPKKVPFPIMVK